VGRGDTRAMVAEPVDLSRFDATKHVLVTDRRGRPVRMVDRPTSKRMGVEDKTPAVVRMNRRERRRADALLRKPEQT
jgi:hypothetical protein